MSAVYTLSTIRARQFLHTFQTGRFLAFEYSTVSTAGAPDASLAGCPTYRSYTWVFDFFTGFHSRIKQVSPAQPLKILQLPPFSFECQLSNPESY